MQHQTSVTKSRTVELLKIIFVASGENYSIMLIYIYLVNF